MVRLLLQVSASEFQTAGKELGIDIKLWHIITVFILFAIVGLWLSTAKNISLVPITWYEKYRNMLTNF